MDPRVTAPGLPRDAVLAAVALSFILLLAAGCDDDPPTVEVDTRPPAVVSDLRVAQVEATSVTLSWAAPADTGGTVALYDIRYRRGHNIIQEGHWAEAVQAADEPIPGDPGDVERLTVTGLEPETKYVFALKTADEEMNDSPVSNSVVTETVSLVDDSWRGGFAPYPDGDGIGGGVAAMLVYGDRLVVGGGFSRAGVLETHGIVQWDGSSWSSLGTGVDGSVCELIEYDGDLVAAGNFQNAGGVAAKSVARWDGVGWHSLGSGLNGCGRSLAVYDGDLFAAGDFRNQDQSCAPALWRWDGSDWHPMEGLPLDDVDAPLSDVNALADHGGYLHAGGRLIMPDSILFAARWDGTDWKVTLSSGPIVSWLTPGVFIMTVFQDWLFLSGNLIPVEFDHVHLAKWNGAYWYPVPRGPGYWDPEQASGVVAFGEYHGNLVAGGTFIRSGPSWNIAWLDGSDWKSFGSGVRGQFPADASGAVSAIAEFQGDLYVGGSFTFAGGKFSSNIACWDD